MNSKTTLPHRTAGRRTNSPGFRLGFRLFERLTASRACTVTCNSFLVAKITRKNISLSFSSSPTRGAKSRTQRAVPDLATPGKHYTPIMPRELLHSRIQTLKRRLTLGDPRQKLERESEQGRLVLDDELVEVLQRYHG